jgi:hypothetical protein
VDLQLRSDLAIDPAEELIQRAFSLAYFILGDRRAALSVARSAIEKLKTALSSQSRRTYYTPTGRSSYPAGRTKVSLNELNLLQRLVYVESEFFERLIEGEGRNTRQEDLIIRYIKHLIRVTTRHNSSYVTLGVCRLLYNYTTPETSEIYNLVLQDPERIRDGYYYRSRKQRLMQEMKQRFGELIKIEGGFRREQRFVSQENSQAYASLVRECLNRFTPWRSSCVLPPHLDPNQNVISELLFGGGHPDHEHQIELNRIHTLIHPHCFAQVLASLGLNQPDGRLELPSFFIANDGARPTRERYHPDDLTSGELTAIKSYLGKNSIHRRDFRDRPLRLVVDGRAQADFDLGPARTLRFNVADESELVEVRSVGSVEDEGETPLAVSLLRYNQTGVIPIESFGRLGSKSRFTLSITPASEAATESRGVIVNLTHETAASYLPISNYLVNTRAWLATLNTSARFTTPRLKLAFLFLLMLLGAVGLWVYRNSRSSMKSSQHVAELAPPPSETFSGPGTPATDSPTQQDSPIARNQRTKPAPAISTTSSRHPAGASAGNASERVREPRPALDASSLAGAKRIYVDSLGDDQFSRQLHEQLVQALPTGGRFQIIGERDAADLVLRRPPARNGSASSHSVLVLVNAAGKITWQRHFQTCRSSSQDATRVSQQIVNHLLQDAKVIGSKP